MNRQSYAPKWVARLLSRLVDAKTLEACLGDLEEKFNSRLRRGMARWRALMLYNIEALGFLRLTSISKKTSLQMTLNQFQHAVHFLGRLIRKDWSYYLVSLFALAISLASFILISIYIQDELSYDQFHQHKDRIFRVNTHLKLSDIQYDLASSAFPAAAAFRDEVPEVQEAVRVFPGTYELQLDEKRSTERVLFADDHFFNVFSFGWLSGDRSTAMTNPASIIITRRLATKYFGSENPVGRSLRINNDHFTVTGLIENIVDQSHLHFDAVIPLQYQLDVWKKETGLEGRENKWFWTGAYTYLLLRPGATRSQVEGRLPAIVEKYFPERYKGGSLELQPLGDIHLTSNLSEEIEPGGNRFQVQLFIAVAIVIMLVSAINLLNLSSFKISQRLREIGIRKFLGQNAARIVLQFSLESILLSLLAFILAMSLCFIFLDGFSNLVHKQIDLLSDPNLKIEALSGALVAGLCMVAVMRPLASLAARPARLLLTGNGPVKGRTGQRNLLIGLQLCFSFIFLVCYFIMGNQIQLFKTRSLGFDKNNIVVIPLNGDIYPHEEAFKAELNRKKNILNVSGGFIPGGDHNGWRFVPEGGDLEKPYLFFFDWVDPDYLKTLRIKLLQGRDFETNRDTTNHLWPLIINKQAALELGWADDAIGRHLKVFAAGTTTIMAEGEVIGVMDDFNYESLRSSVKPVILTQSNWFGTALVRLNENSAASIADLESIWKEFSDKPLQYEFLSDQLDQLYANENRFSRLILFFTVLALYLTCYGMFAMSSLLFRSRLKEVTIRKVFGANQFSIIRHFYSRYALFTSAAIVAGVPIALYVGRLWLENFEFRTPLGASLFLKAAGCLLVAGLLSVSYYLLRVAFSSPVKFLRSE